MLRLAAQGSGIPDPRLRIAAEIATCVGTMPANKASRVGALGRRTMKDVAATALLTVAAVPPLGPAASRSRLRQASIAQRTRPRHRDVTQQPGLGLQFVAQKAADPAAINNSELTMKPVNKLTLYDSLMIGLEGPWLTREFAPDHVLG